MSGKQSKLVCNKCGITYTDEASIAFARENKDKWIASSKKHGLEVKGIGPCPIITCTGELIEVFETSDTEDVSHPQPVKKGPGTRSMGEDIEDYKKKQSEVLKFEVEISRKTLEKFWKELQKVEVVKGTLDEAEPFEIEEAFKEFFYQELGMYGTLDLRDEVKVKRVQL
jgi:hypothetical protein